MFGELVVDESIRHGQDVDLVDLDGDGDLDIIAALSLSDEVRVYLNDGAGQQWTTVSVSGPGRA